MQVTNVRVSFLREKQPAQYEKAQPMVEFAAVLDENDDPMAAALDLMSTAATVVYAGIGYEVPEKVAKALSRQEVPTGGKVEVETEPAEEEKITAENFPGGASDKGTEETKKRGRGRPKGSKNSAPKAGSKAADVAAKAGATAEEAVPGDEPTPNISNGDEDRVDPAQEEVFTAKDLEVMFQKEMQRKPKRISMPNAKQIIHHFGVGRAIDLTDEQALEAKRMLEEQIAAFDLQHEGSGSKEDEVP